MTCSRNGLWQVGRRRAMGDEAKEVKEYRSHPALQAFVRTFTFSEKWNPLDSARGVL